MGIRDESQTKAPQTRLAPEPEGPDEIYRRFERMNRRGASGGPGGLLEYLKGTGKKGLYGALAAFEVLALVLGIFFQVPFMDVVALILPGILLALISGSKNEEVDEPDSGSGESLEEAPTQSPGPEPDDKSEVEKMLERVLGRFGIELPDENTRPGDR